MVQCVIIIIIIITVGHDVDVSASEVEPQQLTVDIVHETEP